MRLHFVSIDVWTIITGERLPPEENASEKVKLTYQRKKARAHSDLLRCLGESFQQLAATYENAQELWQALNELFQPADNTLILTIQRKIEGLETTYPFSSSLLALKQLIRAGEAWRIKE